MLTGYQSLLDQASAFLDAADPETVTIAGITPALQADIGQFRRFRTQEGTGYSFIETGTVVIRRAVLAAAGVTADPESGQNITVRGKVYRIGFVSTDTTSVSLDCVIRS